MPTTTVRLTRIVSSIVALLLSVLLAIGMVLIPVHVLAGATSGGGGGTTDSSGIWAGVSYYWGEWVGTRSDCAWSLFTGHTDVDHAQIGRAHV